MINALKLAEHIQNALNNDTILDDLFFKIFVYKQRFDRNYTDDGKTFLPGLISPQGGENIPVANLGASTENFVLMLYITLEQLSDNKELPYLISNAVSDALVGQMLTMESANGDMTKLILTCDTGVIGEIESPVIQSLSAYDSRMKINTQMDYVGISFNVSLTATRTNSDGAPNAVFGNDFEIYIDGEKINRVEASSSNGSNVKSIQRPGANTTTSVTSTNGISHGFSAYYSVNSVLANKLLDRFMNGLNNNNDRYELVIKRKSSEDIIVERSIVITSYQISYDVGDFITYSITYAYADKVLTEV